MGAAQAGQLLLRIPMAATPRQMPGPAVSFSFPFFPHAWNALFSYAHFRRRQKRTQKEAELAEYRAQMDALLREQKRKIEESSQESEDPESDEADVGDEEARRRRAERKAERKKARRLAKAAEIKSMEERKAFLSEKAAAMLNDTDGDEDAEGDVDVEYEDHPPRIADLDSPPGRYLEGSNSFYFHPR